MERNLAGCIWGVWESGTGYGSRSWREGEYLDLGDNDATQDIACLHLFCHDPHYSLATADVDSHSFGKFDVFLVVYT